MQFNRKAFWDTRKLMPEITLIFAKQDNFTVPAEITEEDYKLIENLYITSCYKEKQFLKSIRVSVIIFSTRES